MHKFQVGQNVYTTKDIRGWFDYSVKDRIPENTPCTVIACGSEDGDNEPMYLVKFSDKVKEFGSQFLFQSSLKLG